MRATFLLTASFALAAATPAFGQVSNSNTTVLTGQTSVPVAIGASTSVTNRVVEPVTQSFDSLISAPIVRDANGVAKAQYFKASDLTPAQNQAFQDEVNRVRTYQSQNGSNTYVPSYTYSEGVSSDVFNTYNSASQPITYGSATPSDNSITYGEFAPTTTAAQPVVSNTSGAYEIELYEANTYGSYNNQNVTVVNEPVATQSFAAATHIIAKGDTLYNLSKRYDVTVGQIQNENGLSGTALSLGQALRIPSSAPLASVNNIAQPIFVSAPVRDGVVTRRVVQPIAATSRSGINYAVLKGDTLFSIAKRSCVSVNDLALQNGISDPASLQLGQKLSMPQGHCLNK